MISSGVHVNNPFQNSGGGMPYGASGVSTPPPKVPDFSQLFSAAGQAAAMQPNPGVVHPANNAAGGSGGNVKVQQDPGLANVQKQYGDYYNQLDSNSDKAATNAMQRQRDLISGMASESAAGAASRGFSGDTGVNQGAVQGTLDAGLKSLGALNAATADSARAQKGNVLGGEASVAGANAANNVQQQNYALSQSEYQQNTNNFQAQLQAMQSQNAFNNMLGLLNTASSFYSGF